MTVPWAVLAAIVIAYHFSPAAWILRRASPIMPVREELMRRWKVPSILGAVALAGSTLFLAACGAPAGTPGAAQPGTAPARPTAPHDFARWEGDIRAFEAADRTAPPPPGAVLFIGSSTIRMWTTLARDFPEHLVLNRGFGGSEIADAAHFADRIVIPYRPRQVFLRAGGNDIHAGRPAEEVAADFADFVKRVHDPLPDTEVVFISLSPAPVRWAEKEENHKLNELVREMARALPRVGFVDCYDLSLTADGQARRELFLADQLHFNAEGYRLLAERVRRYLHGR